MKEPGASSRGDAAACPAPSGTAGNREAVCWTCRSPSLLLRLWFSLQLRAEGFAEPIPDLHQPRLCTTATFRLLPPTCTSCCCWAQFKTPLNSKVLSTTTIWCLWLTVQGQGASSVPSRAGGEGSSQPDRGMVMLPWSNAGRAEHPWLKGSKLPSPHLTNTQGTLQSPSLAGDVTFHPPPLTAVAFIRPAFPRRVFKIVWHILPCSPSSQHQQHPTGTGTAQALVTVVHSSRPIPLPHGVRSAREGAG